MEMWGLADAKKDVSSQNHLSGYTSESGVSGGGSWINFGVGKAMCVLSLKALDLLRFCGVHGTEKDAAWLDEVSLSRQRLAFTV